MTLASIPAAFTTFKDLVLKHSKSPFRSFAEGLPWEWEHYKQVVRDEALRILNADAWQSSEVGSGKILERAIRAIEQKGKPETTNNLVKWDKRFGDAARTHSRMLDARHHPEALRAWEGWLSDFFQGRIHDGIAFRGLQELAGNRYDLLAYLFFLKDWNRFMPIAPETFDRAFAHLGIDLKTSGRASWENYADYNRALATIQLSLASACGLKEVRLIDAHSFCWLLMRLSEKAGQTEA